MQTTQFDHERLFLNSVASKYTRDSYKFFLQKYLDFWGYKDTNDFLTRDPKEIQNELIEFIINSKEKGMKRYAITNYIKPVMSLCKISDIMLNTKKINKFMPPVVRSRKTLGYSHAQIQALLDIADERMRAVILLLSSTGIRIGAVPGLKAGSCEEIKDLYKITIYENEPEEYTVFCTSECRKAIDAYLDMRKRYGEVIKDASPLVREQFDRKDQFAIVHAQHHITEYTLSNKLRDLTEAAGIRTRISEKTSLTDKNEIPVCNGFRRMYSKTLLDSGLTTEYRFLLEGHNLKFNDSSYVKATTEDLLSQFLLAHDNLLISQEHVLKRKVSQLQERNDRLDRVLDRVDKLEKELGII